MVLTFTARSRALVWLAVTALVLVEVAILVPVIVTQKQKDTAAGFASLATFTSVLALRIQRVVNQVAYGVRCTAAIGLLGQNGTRNNVTQYQFEQAVQLEAAPYASNTTVYILILSVRREERAAYEDFYGWPITRLNSFRNATTPSEEEDEYIVFTRFVPASEAMGLLGLNFLAPEIFSQIGVLIQNGTQTYLAEGHATLAGKGARRWGLFIGGYNSDARAYALARVEMEAILTEAIAVPRDQVIVGVWGVFPRESFQLLYLEDSPLLANATTIKRFNESAHRDEFETLTVNVLNGQVLIALKYSDALLVQYSGTAWITLAVILSCVCAFIDAAVVVLVLAWQHRVALHRQEELRHSETQRMMGYVSHEIRNPLQTILGVAEMEQEAVELPSWSAVVRSAEAIECITNDVLDMRRIQAGRLECHIAPVNVQHLFADLALAVRPLLQPGVCFATVVEAASDAAAVRSDVRRLRQILLNFLTNAAKFTSQGLVTLEFAVQSAVAARFSVRDTGRGIPEEKQRALFREFQQVEDDDAYSGFGLGLYLCRMLAKLLQVELGFQSVLGEGTVFWVLVPLESPHALWADFEASGLPLGKS